MPAPRLQMTDVHKAFGATKALRGVSFAVERGEVHALIGENGAGKSTLMKILSGALKPDAGSIALEGIPFRPGNPLHARESGVAMIYQELNLAPHLNAEENILLGREPSRLGRIDRRAHRKAAIRALDELEHHIPLDVPVGELTIAEQQLVEIARALVTEPKVLIMDEPTSSLSRVDTQNLFRVIRQLRERGVSIVYISHFLEECQEIADRFTVLRDGESVGSGRMAGAKLDEIIHLMVGREIADIYPPHARRPEKVIFDVHQLAGIGKPADVTLELRRGEVLGIAGLVGAGRTETLRAVFGLDRIQRGRVLYLDRDLTRRSPRGSWRNGIGMVSENRKEEGLMLEQSLADNLCLTRFRPFSLFGWISRRRQHAASAGLMGRLGVRAREPGQAVGELSGGNQQKIAIGRLLHHDADILLLDEPTRGIDVGSKQQIYQIMNQLAEQGKSVIFVSSYLPELLGVCDRIGVMCRGVLSGIRPVGDWSEHEIIAVATGQK
ncbi:MAG TPA: sugar ABC transporter [Verrucomicrobiales bacterium]|nr:sugar ABC transporter [Verrucomicrobiales bacterium]